MEIQSQNTVEERINIPWLQPADTFQHGGENVDDYIYRIFRHDYTMRVNDPKTKRLISSKDACNISIERYTIVEVNTRTVTINELGRKTDGTYGFRVYDRQSGRCMDDAVPPSRKSRRSIKPF